MRRWRAALAALALIAAPGLWAADATPPVASVDGGLDFTAQVARARDAVLPYVVSILVVREDFNQGEAALSLSGGSGTIVDAAGHIATNAHVTENGVRFRVVLNDDREFPARLVGTDPMSDLAVLRIDAPPGTRFEYARFAGALALKPGDAVLAMGAPWGMKNSVTQGIVSNTERLMVSLFEDETDYEQTLGQGQATARFYAWIQHDASISPGNSGGPLVALTGEIVGVNTRGNVFGGDMAFAIPGPIAADVVAKLIGDGRVLRSDYGFSVRSLRGTAYTEGVLVTTVDRGLGAEQAGLRAGDRIVAVDAQALTVAKPEEVPGFRRGLADRPIGSAIQLTVVRNDGRRETLTLKSVAQEEAKGREIELASWGLSVADLTRAAARSRFLEPGRGVLIQGLRAGGPAATAQPALQAGDLLLSVDGVTVRDVEAVRRRVAPLDEAAPQPVVLAVERRGQKLLSVLTPAPKRLIPEPAPELAKAWAGFDVQPITAALARAAGVDGSGFRVTRVFPGSPAAAAGLAVGDLIQATNEIPVSPSGIKETSALDQRIRNASTLEPFRLTVRRDGRELAKSLNLVEEPTPVARAEQRWNDQLQVVVRALTFYDRAERALSEGQGGVLLERVENGGFGGLAFLRTGDLLVRINDREVTNLDSFEAALKAAERGNEERLRFLVLRGADTRLLFVDAPWRVQRCSCGEGGCRLDC